MDVSNAVPLVSVIVPVHDLADCVERCLDSLLAQTVENFEVICVDDASTDHSSEILHRYTQKDARVRVIHLPQSEGPSVARNKGVEEARGNLVSFVDGDDFVSPHYLQILLDAYQFGGEGTLVKAKNVRGPYEQVCDTVWNMPCEGEVNVLSSRKALRELLLERLSVVAWACLAPRELYLNKRFPQGMVFEDHYVVFNHMCNASRVVTVNTPIYAYVTRPVSLSNPKRHDLRFPKGMHAVVEHMLELSRNWEEELSGPVAWAAAWRLALVVSYCQDIEDKARVRRYYQAACRYLRAHLLRIVATWHRERLDTAQMRKILVAAASPRIYWLLRTPYRGLRHCH